VSSSRPINSNGFSKEIVMPQGSTTLHEPEERLKPETRDMHRAIVSLMEELEAVDWYQQRMDATDDGELRDILRHNRNEEQEHAAMVLEWIRRHSPTFSAHLREYLFTDTAIVGREQAATQQNGGPNGGAAGPAVSVGSLRGAR
jgi:ferritin-like protein